MSDGRVLAVLVVALVLGVFASGAVVGWVVALGRRRSGIVSDLRARLRAWRIRHKRNRPLEAQLKRLVKQDLAAMARRRARRGHWM
jgi:hypothetical protein